MLNLRFIVLILIGCLFITVGQSKTADYICGDANSDGALNVGDAVFMINYVFKNGPAPTDGCCAECEDGQIEPCYTGPPTTQNTGQCSDGTRTCVLGVWGDCIGQSLPQVEVCDGLDNDCDGTVDDGNPDGGLACSTGMPGECAAGTTECMGGTIACIPNQTPTTEICDGLDNDCDGAVDDGNPDGGGYCNTGLPGLCEDGVLSCVGGALVCEQQVAPSTEVCDGLDNDCDGAVDESDPGTGYYCDTGQHGICQSGSLHCISGEMDCIRDYNPTSESVSCYDGLDNDCDGLIDMADPDCQP